MPILFWWTGVPAQSQTLIPLKGEGNKLYGSNETIYELKEREGLTAFARIISSRKNHTLAVEFHPPFPEITHIMDNTALSGEFVISADESAGLVRGNYEISRVGEEVEVTLIPSGGWEPRPKTLFLKFLFKAIKIFRHWPKTYLWKAKIKLNEGALPFMDSKWTRI